MTLRRAVPFVVLGGTLAVLAVPLAIGSAPARIGAGFAIAGMTAGLAGVVRERRVEHADDAEPPSLVELVVDAVAGFGVFWIAIGVYVTLVFLAATAPGSGRRDDATWLGPVLAGGAGVALVVAMVWAVRVSSAKEGVERAIFHESGAIAFVVTVVSAAVYGLFEAFADAPTLSMWAVWGFGMLAFGVATAVLRRRVA